MLSHLMTEITPKNIPKTDLRRFSSLIGRGVPQHEAQETVMQDWRERYARACIATVAGELLTMGYDPRRTLALLAGWAAYEHGTSLDDTRDTVEWVAGNIVRRRRGGVRRAG